MKIKRIKFLICFHALYLVVNNVVPEKLAVVMEQDIPTAVEAWHLTHATHSAMEAQFISGVTTKPMILSRSCVATKN